MYAVKFVGSDKLSRFLRMPTFKLIIFIFIEVEINTESAFKFYITAYIKYPYVCVNVIRIGLVAALRGRSSMRLITL